MTDFFDKIDRFAILDFKFDIRDGQFDLCVFSDLFRL